MPRQSSLLTAVFALLLAAPSARGGEAVADLVLRGATVYTMDAQRPKAEAVAVRAGRIVAVGTSAEIDRWIGPSTEVLDLTGQTVVPGLKESHGHFLGIGFARLNVDLVGTRSLPEVLDRLAPALRAAKPGEWVVGRGWHEGKWTDTSSLTVRGFPTHHALTKLAPDNPVYLTRADGHAAFANARAMELAGITRDTRPPEGGDVIKDANGEPTGIFVDRAMGLVRVPPPTADQTRRAMDLAIEECLAKGVTAFDDAGVGLDAVDLYKEYAASGRLPLRLYVMIRGLETVKRFGKPVVGFGGGFLTVRAVKLSIDGALGSRGAWLLEPYVDDAGNSGLFTRRPRSSSRRRAIASSTASSCASTRSATAPTARRSTASRRPSRPTRRRSDPRWRDEHAQILDADGHPPLRRGSA